MIASETIQAARGLGLSADTIQEVLENLQSGLPGSTLAHLARLLDLPVRDLGAILNIPDRSLSRRTKSAHLPTTESDQILRIARLHAIASKTLGSREKAVRWLRKSNRGFGGRTPTEMLRTEAGARLVEDALGRLAHGVFA